MSKQVCVYVFMCASVCVFLILSASIESVSHTLHFPYYFFNICMYISLISLCFILFLFLSIESTQIIWTVWVLFHSEVNLVFGILLVNFCRKIKTFEFLIYLTMAPKQRMRVANEKASKNITLRGNVPKSTVSSIIELLIFLTKKKKQKK